MSFKSSTLKHRNDPLLISMMTPIKEICVDYCLHNVKTRNDCNRNFEKFTLKYKFPSIAFITSIRLFPRISNNWSLQTLQICVWVSRHGFSSPPVFWSLLNSSDLPYFVTVFVYLRRQCLSTFHWSTVIVFFRVIKSTASAV